MQEDELVTYSKKYMSKVEGFIQNNHYQLVDIRPDYCVMEAEVCDESLNPYVWFMVAFYLDLQILQLVLLLFLLGEKR